MSYKNASTEPRVASSEDNNRHEQEDPSYLVATLPVTQFSPFGEHFILTHIFTAFSYLCFISSTLRRWDKSAAIQELFSFLWDDVRMPLLLTAPPHAS